MRFPLPELAKYTLIVAVLIAMPKACGARTISPERSFCRNIGVLIDAEMVIPECLADNTSAEAQVFSATTQPGRTADVQISTAIRKIAGRNGTVLANYSTDQTFTGCPIWGSRDITLVLYPVTYTVATDCVIPTNVTLQFSHGSCLRPANGTAITIQGYFTAPMSKIFCNAIRGQGIVRLASANTNDEGGQVLVNIYPEWWGASSSDSTGETNTPAIQAAIVGAYGNNRSNFTSFSKFNRVLHFSTVYSINAELQVYHMVGFRWTGENQFNSGLRQRTCGVRIIDGQSVAYGQFQDLRFENGCGGKSAAALVDIDYNGAQGADLRPQNITFYDDLFAGANLTDVGVLVAKSGGGAQGDNIRCYNCYFSGFTGAAWQVGGNNTGRNVGRFYAQNAIKEQIIGGDIQGCPLYGVAVYGGSIEISGTTMENDSLGVVTQTGFDVYCEAPQDRCILHSVRSESHKLAAGSPILIEHSRTIFQPSQWYSASRRQSLARTRWPVHALFSGTGQGGDGKYYQITAGGTFGGLGLTSATGGGTSTTITDLNAHWIPSEFTGQQVTIVSGTGNGEYCAITSNTVTTITCTAGWATNYYHLEVVNPDKSSNFVVEPNWSSKPTKSGTVTFTPFEFNVIEGNAGAGIGDGELYDVSAPGGQIKVGGPYSKLQHVSVSRPDWNSAGPMFEDSLQLADYDDIYIEKPDQDINVGGTTKRIAWKFGRNRGGDRFFVGITQKNMGTKPICWSYGQNGGGASVNDVCIGIRTDNNSLNSVGRSVLGILGTVGPVTPFGTNSRGEDLSLTGGLSTGSGMPGGISFRLGEQGSSGRQVNDSTEISRIDFNGFKLPSFTFAKLPAAKDGYVVFCVDCNSTCTDAGGKGRTCFRENGAWTH